MGNSLKLPVWGRFYVAISINRAWCQTRKFLPLSEFAAMSFCALAAVLTLGLRLPIHAPAVKLRPGGSVFMSTDDTVLENDPPPANLAAQICDLAEALPDHLVSSGSSTVPTLSCTKGGRNRFVLWPNASLAGGGPTVKDVLSACTQAPVGRGTETVVDTSVRRVKETESIAVQWPGLPAALEQVQRELCPWLDLEAKLYKVLVYQEGDFFTWHLDSKKEQDHVMTMTVDCGAPNCKGGGIEFKRVPVAQWRSDAVLDDDDLKDWFEDNDEAPPDWYEDEMRKRYRLFCQERGYDMFETRSYEDNDYNALKETWSNELLERETRRDEEADARKKKRLWSAGAPGDWCCWSITEEHRVQPVTKGCRIVAVYNILGRQRTEQEPGMVPPQQGVLPSQQPGPSAPEVQEQWSQLINMLSEPPLTRVLQANGCHRVGFLLHHEYNFDTRYDYQEPNRMPLSELMGRDRVLYEAALAAGHSVVQVEQCTLRYELVVRDEERYDQMRGYDYQYVPDDLGRVRIARSTMDPLTLVKEGGPTVYEWLDSIQYYSGEQHAGMTGEQRRAVRKQAHARKFEVPDLLKPLVGANTLTPVEASHICDHIDFDDYSDPSTGFVHNVNDVYWPFRDVWWACSESSIKRQYDVTKKFSSHNRDYTGEFFLPLWGNSAKWEYYSHGRAVLLVQIRSDETDSPRPLANDL